VFLCVIMSSNDRHKLNVRSGRAYDDEPSYDDDEWTAEGRKKLRDKAKHPAFLKRVIVTVIIVSLTILFFFAVNQKIAATGFHNGIVAPEEKEEPFVTDTNKNNGKAPDSPLHNHHPPPPIPPHPPQFPHLPHKHRRPPPIDTTDEPTVDPTLTQNEINEPPPENNKVKGEEDNNNNDFAFPIIGERKITSANPRILSFRRGYDARALFGMNGYVGREKQEAVNAFGFIEDLKKKGKPPLPVEEGSVGIVTSCNLEPFCIANIIYLTEILKSDVPLEVWIERTRTPKGLAVAVPKMFPQVRFRYIDDFKSDYEKVFGPVNRLNTVGCFHIKMMAILGSEFEKLIWVDSDAFLLQNATKIMAQTETGTLFWHDIWSVAPDNPIWSIMRIEPIHGLSQESGVVYIDKAVNWLPLYLSAYMNQRQRLFYSLLWGDKDTFFISCAGLKKPYTFVPWGPYPVGKMGNEMVGYVPQSDSNKKKFYGFSFVQLDMEGKPAYVHLVTGKDFILPSLDKGDKLFTTIRAWDPNTAHMINNGIDAIKRTFDIVVDSGSFYGPLWDTNEVLGPFEERLTNSYRKALEITKEYE